MSDSKTDIVRKWFEKAANDLENIENNFKSNDVPADTVYCHAQQAIKKYFKGVLVHHDREIGLIAEVGLILNRK